VPDLIQLYERHAEECACAAERTDSPRHRALLVKCAAEWREAAQGLRQSPQPNVDGARDRAASAQEGPAPQRAHSQRGAARLPEGTLARIAKVLKPKKSRTVFVAKAVEAALKRREAKRKQRTEAAE